MQLPQTARWALGLAAALQGGEGAEGTRLTSSGATHASAKPAAGDGGQTGQKLACQRGEGWLRRAREAPCLLPAHSPLDHGWLSDRQVCSCQVPACPPLETPLFP